MGLGNTNRIPGAKIIASGGIEDGVMMAKALALGADLCGAALPFLRVLMEKGTDGLVSVIHQWREALKMVMFLTGSLTIKQLHRKGILRKTL